MSQKLFTILFAVVTLTLISTFVVLAWVMIWSIFEDTELGKWVIDRLTKRKDNDH